MRKITLLLILMISSLGFSQQETFEINFETGTTGSDATTWNVFENDSNPVLEVVANPDATGDNTSATVAKFTALVAGQPYAGTEVQHAVLGEWFLEASNTSISVMVYKTVISDVTVKFVNSTSGTVFQIAQPNTKINEWETLTYDISSAVSSGENHNIDQFVIFPEWSARTTETVTYFDNVTWTANRTKAATSGDSGAAGAAPTAEAPTPPTREAGDVISVFSDAYTNVTNADYNSNWGQSGLSTANVAYDINGDGDGNNVLAYTNFNYQGMQFDAVDASSMEFLHLDIWTPATPADTDLQISPINNGTGTSETLVSITYTTGTWTSLDIPIADFTGMTWDSIFQFKLAGNGAGSTVPVDIYVDNIYFYKGDSTTSATEPTTAAPTPTNLEADVISVYSDAYTSIATDLNPNWQQATAMTEIDIAGNLAMKYANLNYQGLEYTSTDVSAMEYIHLDYYTVDATNFDFYLIAGGENAYDVDATDGITTGEWVSIDIPLSFFSDAGRDLTAAFQFKTVGDNNLFLDNIYFWKEPTAAGTDTSLSDLTVDGTTITGFAPLTTSYSIELAGGTTTVPTLVATTTDGDATSVITNATSLPGDSTILITAKDGTTTNTVTVSFTLDPTPTVVAPTPTNLEADVISVYSDAYTSIATNLNPNWGQATAMTEIDINGNKFMEYANLNYQGLEYTSSDVSAMDYIHLDYYTTDTTNFDFYLIAGGENAYDVDATDGITTGEWVGIDIPLSFFSDAGRDLTAAFQFKTVGDNNLFLDNIYFYKEATASVSSNELLNISMYPNPTSSRLNISAQSTINSAAIYNLLGKQVMSLEINKTSESIDVSNLSSGIYLIKYTVNNAVGTAKFIKE